MRNKVHSKTTFLTILIVFLAISNSLFATSYYISNSGSDKNKGTSPNESWQTIAKLNATKLKAGDVILFHRGDKFEGELEINASGTETKPIIITAYGKGEKPMLSGAIKIEGFELYKPNIYKSKQENVIKTLYKKNVIQDIARFPNTGFLKFCNQDEFLGISAKNRDNVDGKNVSKFRTYSLTEPNGFWNNASIRYRPVDWEWGFSEIESWKDGIITMKDSCRYGISQGWAYIMENKIELLDTLNEWCYDKNQKSIFVWSEELPLSNPEGVIYDCGIKLASNVSFININNISFNKYEKTGIYAAKNNNNVVIDSCTFQYMNGIGVQFMLISKNSVISNSYFTHLNGRAISAYEPENMKVSGNKITNIGMKVGYGITGVNGMAGIVIENTEEMKPENAHICLNNHVYNNYIDSIGHMGIRMDGTQSVIENNVVKNCNFNMNDCGSIYCWTNAKPNEKQYTYGNTIRNNLIINSFGSNYGTPGNAISAQGIYLDGVGWMIVDGNVIVNVNGAGIFINSGSHNQLKNNLVYNNPTGIAIYNQNNSGNEVIHNTMFPISKNQRAFNIMNWRTPAINYQKIDSNIVYSLTEKYIFTEEYLTKDSEIKTKNQYTWKSWKEKSGQDLNSTIYDYQSDLSIFENSTIIYNDSFEAKEFDLTKNQYDIKGNKINQKFKLKPLESMIIFSK